MKKTVTYGSAGVNIDEGDRLVSLIRPIVGTTHRREVLGGIGGFAGVITSYSIHYTKLYELDSIK